MPSLLGIRASPVPGTRCVARDNSLAPCVPRPWVRTAGGCTSERVFERVGGCAVGAERDGGPLRGCDRRRPRYRHRHRRVPGSAQLAGSASARTPRTVTLRLGDVAVLGRLQCVATSDSRRYPMKPGAYYLRCSKRPDNQARYVVHVFPGGAVVSRPGTLDPLYRTPRWRRTRRRAPSGWNVPLSRRADDEVR